MDENEKRIGVTIFWVAIVSLTLGILFINQVPKEIMILGTGISIGCFISGIILFVYRSNKHCTR